MIPVIVPSYRNPRQLARCLDALAKQDAPVVPWVHENSVVNLYYVRPVNELLRRAISEGHEYAVCGAQDCYLRPDAALQLARFMAEHPRCAIAGIKQVFADDEDRIYHGGCTIAWPGGVHLGGRVSCGDCRDSAPMPWVNGTCIIVRLAAIADIGLMDEGYRLLCCDSDWCYTARTKGWEVWYCAQAEGVHEVGVSSKPPTDEVLEVFRADVAHFESKWLRPEFWPAIQTLND